MAKRTVTILTDDLDGTESEDVTTVQFAWDGKSYSIDLTAKNLNKFEKAIRPYADVATRVNTPTGARSSTPRRGAARQDLDEVRAWASANGYTVGDRGRVKGEILEAYDASH